MAGITVDEVRAYGTAANTSYASRWWATTISNKTSGQIWILSGLITTLTATGTNTVSSSTDMINWSIYNATFTPRSAAVSGLDANGTFYIGTGLDILGQSMSDFWWSRDAMNWSIACSPCKFTRRHLAKLLITTSLAVNADVLILLGGTASNFFSTDVFISSDSAFHWSLVTQSASFPSRLFGVMDVTTSNTLMVSLGSGANQVYYEDLWLSFDGSFTWNKCRTYLPMRRAYIGWTFDADEHLLIFGGNIKNDVWRSIIPFNDSVLLAQWCSGTSSRSPMIVPETPGLQCWPNTTHSCTNINETVIGPSLIKAEYTLAVGLLPVTPSFTTTTITDGGDYNNAIIKGFNQSSNLFIWSTYQSDYIQSSNVIDSWSSTADVNTVYSSTSWSPLIVTNRPTLNDVHYEQVASTYDYACARMHNGTVICWGSNVWYAAWPRCIGTVCMMYGNLCIEPTDCTNIHSVINRFYSTFNPPTTYEPYIDMCVTGAYACALSANADSERMIICWMGIYGTGSRIVRWNTTVSRVGKCGRRSGSVSVCPASMMNDSTPFDNEQFTAIRCQQFSVCGLTLNGSIICSSLPVRYDDVMEDMIIRPNEFPFVRIGQSDSNALCGVLANGRIRCNPSSKSRLGVIADTLLEATALSPQHHYRVGGGTGTMPCYGGSYSDRPGAISSLCSGPCSAGNVGADDQNHTFTKPQCRSACPAGNWCPQAATNPSPCLIGTFGLNTGLRQSIDCLQCTGNGQYCPPGSIAPLLCPRGAYCLTPDKYIPCKPGTFGDTFGLHDASCSGECDAGFVCTEYSVTAKQQPCPSGQYNNAKGQSVCRDCAPGTYAKLNVSGTTACTNCSAGEYSSVNGTSTCLECLPGHYASTSGQSVCQQCMAGTFAKDPAAQQCIDCPVGQYSPTNASSFCTPCSPGHYNDMTAQTFCQQCLAGTFANVTGMQTCMNCSAGQHSFNDGASICNPCPLGQFSDKSGQSSCTDCPPGTASENIISGDTRCLPCLVGSYTSTYGNHVCNLCAAGTYNLLNGSTECLPCSSIDGVECDGSIATVSEGYHGAVMISRNTTTGDIILTLTTQPCPTGYCRGTTRPHSM